MIPLSDSTPTRGTPVVNRLLLLVNLAVWFYVVSLSGDPAALEEFYVRWSFDWTAFQGSLAAGTFSTDLIVPLITHMFIHGGWLHILGNMLYLWIFGDNIEDRLGSAPYLTFYVLCGIAAAVGQGLIAPAPMVGASGAVAGVLGAYLLLFPGSRIRTLIFLGIFITIVPLPAILVIGMWIVLQILSGLAELRMTESAGQIAFFAHVAGFFAGMLLLLVLRPRVRRPHPRLPGAP